MQSTDSNSKKDKVRESFNRGEQQHGLVPKEEGGKTSILSDIRERYSGEQFMNRYSGQGKYKYEHGTYEGEFLAGKFHGEGKLYVRGGYWTGIWEEGQLKFGKKFVFDDELDHKGPNEVEWPYCSATDPRFYREIKEGVPPEGPLKHMICHKREVRLPAKCYDTVDGYYDPKKYIICSYETGNEIRKPNAKEQEWIVKNCRINQ